MPRSIVESDSRRVTGGRIPGAPGVPAFTQTGLHPSPLPILLAVPHAGRAYPEALLRRMRDPEAAALKLEDRYVDRLAAAVAAATGATLLVAHAPRAMIDLNRAPDDIDWEMFGGSRRNEENFSQNRRARSGLGLIPRRLPGTGELWKGHHLEEELDARISGIHDPYHQRLSATLTQLRDRWGVALLIDLHSMPPIVRRGGRRAPEFVVGDRFGSTCHGSLTAAAFAYFGEEGCETAHNCPYAGGYVLERHSAPRDGLHAVQIEIDRGRYLDSRLAEPGPGFAEVIRLLTGLARRLATEVCSLTQPQVSQGWAEAAE